jgi:regulator of protease activity HflC (stomatin/prohibitin superfamily)
MDETQEQVASPPNQLRQVRVPLHEAAEVFARPDENGRTPIIVTPQRMYRYLNGLIVGALVAFAVGLFGEFVLGATWLFITGHAIGLALLVLGIIRWFYVQVPEGVNALLSRGGRYVRTLGSGLHFLAPYIMITHLVTRREIPFDVPVAEARTSDNVRADVDALVTFSIAKPSEFVYRITASDFDQVFQASCQEAVRALVRDITSNELSDLVRHDASDLSTQMTATVSPYGVTVNAVIIVYVQPPVEYLVSQEAKQLAVLQREEQTEKQALAERRQADADALTRQQLLARVEREQEELHAQLRRIEARREIVAREADIEAERLARLEERLRAYPLAAQWEWQGVQIDVARALAGNTRAILNVRSADDIARALMMRETLQDTSAIPPEDAVLPKPLDGITTALPPIGQGDTAATDAASLTSNQPAADA